MADSDGSAVTPPYTLVPAAAPAQFEAAGRLFREYAADLGVDLCFQGFESELLQLPVMYAPPDGGLLLAMRGAAAVGCGAVRGLSGDIGELKRLYVRPPHRGVGVGRLIAEQLLERARRLGYGSLRLDTLDHMTAARTLYQSLGFREIPAYYASSLPNSVYLEVTLRHDGACAG